jgi:hypothetical protein
MLHDPQCSRKNCSNQLADHQRLHRFFEDDVFGGDHHHPRQAVVGYASIQTAARPGRSTALAFPLINQLKTGGTIVRQDGLRLFGFLQSQCSYPQVTYERSLTSDNSGYRK